MSAQEQYHKPSQAKLTSRLYLINQEVPHPLLDSWKTAYERGIAGDLCDRIVRVRDVPPALASALWAAAVETAKQDAGLNDDERETLKLLSVGWKAPNIAAAMEVSEFTVKSRIRSISQKLGTKSILHSVAEGIRRLEIN